VDDEESFIGELEADHFERDAIMVRPEEHDEIRVVRVWRVERAGAMLHDISSPVVLD
jgi:hypothetical protein